MSKKSTNRIDNPSKIKNYWFKERNISIAIIFFGTILNVSVVFAPILLGKLINTIVENRKLEINLLYGLYYISLFLVIQLSRFYKRLFVRKFANRTSKTMRLMIYNNIMNKTVIELENENVGDLMARCISDVEITTEGMRKATTEVFDTGVLLVSYIVSLLIYNWAISLLGFIFIPVALLLAFFLKHSIYKTTIKYRKKFSEVNSSTYSLIDNAILYRTHNVLEKKINDYDSELEDLREKAIKSNILENSMGSIYKAICLIGVFFVVYFAGKLVIDGDMMVGDFSAYIALYIALVAKVSRTGNLFNSIEKSRISWQRIEPYLSSYKSKDSTINVNNIGLLEVNNLSFGYPNDNKTIINNISFKARKGEIIGITGPIASGKSTLGLSLLGLYPYLGNIKINDKELSSYNETEKSFMISYLSHNPYLLSDTIYNNITLGNNIDISDVLKDVCFEEDMLEMDEKEQTLIGSSGVRLSGGQQARIALARALINKNEVIILDDPFSSVDMKTEERIIMNLKNNYKDSIIIIISHRLSIFKDIDKVIMLDKEYIYGTHQDVMNKSKLYNQIFTLQEGDMR